MAGLLKAAAAALLVAAGCRHPRPPPAPATAAPAPAEASLDAGPAPVVPDPDLAAAIALAQSELDGAAVEAIAQLEAFVAAHPDDPEHTPDALLRLGQLHLDLAAASQARGDRDGGVLETNAAIGALARVIDQFPRYAHRDAALAILASAYDDAGDPSHARGAYQQLAAIAGSPYAADAWYHLGELAFDGQRLDEAARAYSEALAAGDARIAPFARYKRAWTYYRLERMADAVAGFQAVLDAGDLPDLRAEVIAYLALSLTEPDWDGDGKPDPAPRGARSTAAVARVAAHLGAGQDPDRRAIAEQAASALHEETRDAEAVAVYRALLTTPLEPGARARIEAALAALGSR